MAKGVVEAFRNVLERSRVDPKDVLRKEKIAPTYSTVPDSRAKKDAKKDEDTNYETYVVQKEHQ